VKNNWVFQSNKVEEIFVEKQYIEQRDQDYWISGSRVSLESVIFAFLNGLSPETIVAECFPVLSLEQVYGAITYYLSNRQKVDAYLQRMSSEFDAFQQTTHDPEFARKMVKARTSLPL
jgi:uncharacterized protein (DUF433 family)